VHLPLPSLAHKPDGQVEAVGVLHDPVLLQTDAGVAEPLWQFAALQTVLLSGKVQALALVPLHWPLQGAVPPQAAR
jgi:hypothetical protein